MYVQTIDVCKGIDVCTVWIDVCKVWIDSNTWWGDQASALTAAVWSLNLEMQEELLSQMKSLLSLPPEAKNCPSKLHFSPQTSCLCPTSLAVYCSRDLTSLLNMIRSLLPEDNTFAFHANDPTLNLCPVSSLIFLLCCTSHNWTTPEFVPTAKWVPCVKCYLLNFNKWDVWKRFNGNFGRNEWTYSLYPSYRCNWIDFT